METPLKQQSSEAVFAKEELIVAYIKEAFPTLDLTPGTALRDLVVRMYAHLETRIQEQIDLALVSSSLLEIAKNPEEVDDVQLERLLANYNVTRSQGATAFGKLRLFLNTTQTLLISNTTEIVIDGILFNPADSFLLLANDVYTAAPGQRLITPSGNLFTAVIDLVAAEPGASGNVRTGSLAESITPSPSSLVSAKVDSDFTGGADADNNQVLLERMRAGIVGKVFGGRAHIKAKLKAQFSGVMDVGCVGFADPEMRRDLFNGVHTGGKIDVFVKSSSYPSRIQEQMTPKFISFNQTSKEGLFEITLPNSTSSGLYTIESIRAQLTQTGTFELISDTRGFAPSIHTSNGPNQSSFSAIQTVTFRFAVPFDGMIQAWNSTETAPTYTDFVTNLNNYLTQQETQGFFKFYIEYLKMPDLQEIQAYMDLAAERNLSADMLVHAPVPVMSSIQLKLLKKAGSLELDLAKLKSAIVSKFNSYGFGEAIPGSALIHTAYENLPEGYVIDLPIHMYGVLINPDLTKDVLFSSDSLKPPINYAKGVSSNNVCFFLESNLVDIAIKEC